MINLTPELLRRATECERTNAERAAPHLHAACALYGITTPARMAAFLAQLAVESGRFRYLRELADGSAYEGKASLGNTEPGDGQRYRGRGWIQITGRANYRDTAARMRGRLPAMQVPDFEADPEALEDPRWASLASADWWAAHKLNDIADRTLDDGWQIDRISRAINRGNPDADRPANHETERRAAWVLALSILRSSEAVSVDDATQVPAPSESAPSDPPDAAPWPSDPYTQEGNMPAPLAIMKAVLPTVVNYLPQLGKIFGSGTVVSDRNIKAVEIVGDVLVKATNAANVQEAVEKISSDPQARQAATEAVAASWWEIAEAGGGGIDGARKADAAAQAGGDIRRSASFWVACLLLPLPYLLVLSLIGLIGTATWSDDVRAGLAGSLISAIVGGLVGYYYGQTTSRNRTQGVAQ